LVRFEHHHEPKSTTCPTLECGQPMVRVSKDTGCAVETLLRNHWKPSSLLAFW